MATHKLSQYPKLKAFLATEKAATIAVPVDDKGTIHAASLLFWNSTEPLAFYFVTNRNSQKCKLLKTHSSIPAACVVGTSKGAKFTLQMRGRLYEAPNANLHQYYIKRGDHFDDIADAKNMCLVFHPNWARFTDYDAGYERHVLDLGE